MTSTALQADERVLRESSFSLSSVSLLEKKTLPNEREGYLQREKGTHETPSIQTIARCTRTVRISM